MAEIDDNCASFSFFCQSGVQMFTKQKCSNPSLAHLVAMTAVTYKYPLTLQGCFIRERLETALEQ